MRVPMEEVILKANNVIRVQIFSNQQEKKQLKLTSLGHAQCRSMQPYIFRCSACHAQTHTSTLLSVIGSLMIIRFIWYHHDKLV